MATGTINVDSSVWMAVLSTSLEVRTVTMRLGGSAACRVKVDSSLPLTSDYDGIVLTRESPSISLALEPGEGLFARAVGRDTALEYEPTEGTSSAEGEGIVCDRFLMKYLRLSGNGSKNLGVDGSVTPQTFYYENDGVRGNAHLSRSNIVITCTAPRPSRFGDLNELTNGIVVEIRDDNGFVRKQFNDGEGLKLNRDFAFFAGGDHVQYENFTGEDAVKITWAAQEHSGFPIIIPSGYRFEVIVQDDLSSLTDFEWVLQGHFDHSDPADLVAWTP